MSRIELMQGTLDMLLILETLRWGAQHGYGIAQAIRAGSSDVLQVETGSLYPALHRLERQRSIKAEWRQSENRQRAKYYSLTAAGRKHLCSRARALEPTQHGHREPSEGAGKRDMTRYGRDMKGEGAGGMTSGTSRFARLSPGRRAAASNGAKARREFGNEARYGERVCHEPERKEKVLYTRWG